MACVSLEHVTKTYPARGGSIRAVADLSLDVRHGELLVVVGPSGCGKSTTLRLIAGLERPSAGTIRIGPRVVNDVPPPDRNVAMVFQHLALYPHLTVFGNLAFGLRMRRFPRPEIERRVRAAAERLGLAHLLDRRPGTLSGGECQRVALGRALVREPRVFLLDEPLSHLDVPLRAQMRMQIKAVQRDLRTAMIYVTHDQAEAMVLGDRVAVMRDGAIQQCGEPMDVYDRPANRFVAGFIGTPPMNLITGRLRADGQGLRFDGPGWDFPFRGIDLGTGSPVADREAVLGIRPQHLFLAPDGAGSRCRLAPGRVRWVESTGDLVYLHIELAGGAGVIARSEAVGPAGVDDEVEVFVEPGRVHLFGADERGARLAPE